MDRKLETFLAVCRTMNYRAAAEEVHLTQPAVTKQIQALEAEYNARLFHYDGHHLEKTEKGRVLEQQASSIQYNYEELRRAMEQVNHVRLRVGATKTIGDYVIGPAVMKYLEHPHRELMLTVDNTEHLLNMLNANELDFAILEGRFDKGRYEHRLLRKEPFIGICARGHRFAGKRVRVEELFSEMLIVREPGSGTRDILEHQLTGMGYALHDFSRVAAISSFKLIRELVQKDLGISFLYEAVVGDDSAFGKFTVEDFAGEFDFQVVSLKNTRAGKYAEEFLREGGMGA